jgi:hypothetical protein
MRDFLQIQHPTFDPKTVQIMADAFDAAWAVIEPTVTATDENLQEQKLALAKRIVELVSHGDYDVQTLRDTAIASMMGPGRDAGRAPFR